MTDHKTEIASRWIKAVEKAKVALGELEDAQADCREWYDELSDKDDLVKFNPRIFKQLEAIGDIEIDSSVKGIANYLANINSINFEICHSSGNASNNLKEYESMYGKVDRRDDSLSSPQRLRRGRIYTRID